MAEEGEAPETVNPSWEGERDDMNLPVGEGLATYPNGDTYQGTMKAGLREGSGTYTFANGNASYVGGYKENKKSGKGKFTYPDGATYEGDWEGDLRHGQGTYTYVNGDYYEGEWKDGKKNGSGVYSCKSKGIFLRGEFADGVYTKGELRFVDGTVYNGSFNGMQPKAGEEGTFAFPNGFKVSGKFLAKPAEAAEEEEGEEAKAPELYWT